MKQYKLKRKLSEFTCDNCGNKELKPDSELKRNISLNRKNFCSRSCSISFANKASSKNRKRYDISKHANNRKDEFTSFKYTFRVIKRRYKEFNLAIEDLANQWNKQNGICPFTKFNLILPTDSNKIHFSKRASLDRIDSTKGYIKGNIQFVSTMINFLKSNLGDQDVIQFRNDLIKNYCPCYQGD